MAVPQVRQAVHNATAPRQYAKPKTRVRQAAAPATATALNCPPPMVIGVPMTTPAFGIPVDTPGVARVGELPVTPIGFVPPSPDVAIPPDPGPAVTPPPSVVPDPGTWVLLLSGFGAVGLALRARRSGSSDIVPETGEIETI